MEELSNKKVIDRRKFLTNAAVYGAGLMGLLAIPEISEGKSVPKRKFDIPEPLFEVVFKEILLPNEYMKDYEDEIEILGKGGMVNLLGSYKGTSPQLKDVYKKEIYSRIHESQQFVGLEQSLDGIIAKLHRDPKYVIRDFANIGASSVVEAKDGENVIVHYALRNEHLLPNLVFRAYGTVAKRRNGNNAIDIYDFDGFRTNDFVNSPPTGIVQSKKGVNFTELYWEVSMRSGVRGFSNSDYTERRLVLEEKDKSPVMDLADMTSSQERFLDGLKKQRILYDRNWKPVI